MLRIDSHNHFWLFNKSRDSWITDEMSILRRNFLPSDLDTEMRAANMNGCISVQADQSEEETRFLLSLANKNPFIKGVVGWIDLCADNVEERLLYYAEEKKLKGFRHILQGETDRAFMLMPSFNKGIAALHTYGFVYDIIIHPDQLPFIHQFIKQHPQQKFVIDHIAKPNIKAKEINDWQTYMRRVAQFPNVYCKVSGVATEADWKRWQPADFVPYLEVVWNAFGAERVMFGSDWPVCLLATSYQRWIHTMEEYTASFSEDEKEYFWGKSASVCYNLADR